MLHLGLIVCEKWKVKVSVYFEPTVFSFILKFVSTKRLHKMYNKQIDFDAFDLQKIKLVGSLFYSLIIADNIVINLSFFMINGNLLKNIVHSYIPFFI